MCTRSLASCLYVGYDFLLLFFFSLYTHRWYRIDPSGPVSLDDSTFSFGVLVLENVQLEDSGVYRCTASNSVGQAQYDLRLDVIEALKVHLWPKDIVVNQGSSVTVHCAFNSQSQASVKWYKDAVLITPRDKYQTIGKDSLHITNMQRGDQGFYQCFVYTENESAQDSTRVTLGGLFFFKYFITKCLLLKI